MRVLWARRFRRIWVAYVVGLGLILMIGCGDQATKKNTSDLTKTIVETEVYSIGDRPEISAWTRPSTEFSYDECIAAGWKQHQIYDVDTLPNALEARYGFFNRRDVEIRRYPSHAAAMNEGADAAEEALDRTVHDGSGFRSRRVYGGYLVAGNLVMMCEVSTDDCLDLIETVENVAKE